MTNETASEAFARLDEKVSPEDRLLGQERTKQLQKEIESKIAAKNAEAEKKAVKKAGK